MSVRMSPRGHAVSVQAWARPAHDTTTPFLSIDDRRGTVHERKWTTGSGFATHSRAAREVASRASCERWRGAAVDTWVVLTSAKLSFIPHLWTRATCHTYRDKPLCTSMAACPTRPSAKRLTNSAWCPFQVLISVLVCPSFERRRFKVGTSVMKTRVLYYEDL